MACNKKVVSFMGHTRNRVQIKFRACKRSSQKRNTKR